MVDGLIGGLTGKLGALRDRVTGMAGNVRGWFADVLDINSPSRVFTQLGGYTVDGLNRGLDAQRGEPARRIKEIARRVTRAGAGLALGTATLPAAAMPSIEQQAPIQFDTRPPLSSQASVQHVDNSSNHYHITINAASGSDAHEIANIVNHELDRREREKSARNRSSLRDLD